MFKNVKDKKIKFLIIFLLCETVFSLSLLYIKNGNNVENEDKEKIDYVVPDSHKDDYKIFDLDVYAEEGEDIYNPGDNFGYRYGPSMIINDDGSIDAWFSRPGNNSTMWDYISYRHMYPNGDWGDEEVVLTPTPGSLDHYSCCDPGVIYFNGYYYLGYTSTTNSEGMENQIFVARSESPNGYYEKWNGNGWGGDPEPIITYEGNGWGAGEISFVIDGNTLECYYTWKDDNGNYMKCSQADLSENWPSTIKNRCISIYKKGGQCSCDVVYLDDYNIYLAFSIDERMLEDSYLLVQYSKDGREFEDLTLTKTNINNFAHNLGITKYADGHISLDNDLYIGYAYSNENIWGKWKTYFQKISFE